MAIKRELNGAEALMGFLSYLSTREKPVTFSRHHAPHIAIELLQKFEAVNAIGTTGPDWPDCMTVPEEGTTTNQEHEDFVTQLTRLINHHSLEGASNTPDFILAEYLVSCLKTFGHTMTMREAWYGRPSLEGIHSDGY
jgi:hypothetical protein